MKKVFSSHEEVAHIWAQQTQSEGKASRIFFDGPTIFSYGRHFPIAKFIDAQTVLFTTKGYSTSTNKHKSYVARAIPPSVTVFPVHDVLATNHAGNILDMAARVEELRRKALKARKNGEYYRADALKLAISLKAFVSRFPHVKDAAGKRRVKALTEGDMFSPENLAAVKEWERLEKKRQEREARKREAELREKIDAWKAGVSNYCPNIPGKTYLRVEGNGERTLVTSHDARIPLEIARRVWERIKNGGALAGMNLGYYKVDSFDGSVLIAGCHRIEMAEMSRLAAVLGW